MASYTYQGRNKAGDQISGKLEASTADAVAELLLGRGVTPIKIEEILESTSKNIELDLFKPKVTLDDLILFSRQMYSLARSGVGINRAMRGLADSAKNQTLAEILLDVERSLNTGMALSLAMRRHIDVFGNMYVNIIEVGEDSGKLEAAFKQLYGYLETEKDTRRRISSAVRYPTFVLIAISIAMIVLNIFVIPVFAELFEKFGADLPLPTKILIGTSNFFTDYWLLIVIFVGIAIFSIRYYLSTEDGLLVWDKYKLRIPIIGSILERSMLARFGRSFSMMLSSGVSLVRALELCSQAVGNTYLGHKIRGMRKGIERGETLVVTARHSEMFTPLVIQMLSVGEETGNVDEMLAEVAGFYEQEVDYDLKNLSSYIEPLLIAAMAGLVAVIALGIFLPMWDMFGVMQGK